MTPADPKDDHKSDAWAQTSLAVGLALLLGGLGDKIRDLMNFREMLTPHWLGEFLVTYGGTLAALVGAWLRKPGRSKKQRTRMSDSQFYEIKDLIITDKDKEKDKEKVN